MLVGPVVMTPKRSSRPLTTLFAVVACTLAASPAALAATGSGGSGGMLAGEGGSGPSPSAPAGPVEVGGMAAGAASASPSPALPGAPASAVVEVPFGALIATSARRHAVPVALFTALVWQESGFRANARSTSGARGLTQLMPATARELGVRRIYDPVQNLDGGARYLKSLLARFGSASLALAAYNAGPTAVVRHRGIPPYPETRRYVRAVLAYEARLRAAGHP